MGIFLPVLLTWVIRRSTSAGSAAVIATSPREAVLGPLWEAMRTLALSLALLAAVSAGGPEFVQAVEFPYYYHPRALWERELVWLKNIGVETIEFPIPYSFHQTASGEPDLTGSTNPRRDLTGRSR